MLLTFALDILLKADEATVRVQGFAAPGQGLVTLGLTPTTSGVLAAPLIRRLAAEVPRLKLRIAEEMSSVLVEWVAAERLHMALAYNVAAVPGLRWEPLAEEPLVFVESAAGGKTNGGTITLAEAARHRLLLPDRSHSVRRLLDAVTAPLGLGLDIPYEIQSVATLRDLVIQGVGASIMPFGALRKEVAAGSLIAKRVVEPVVRRRLFFIYSNRRPLSQTEHIFKQLLRALVIEEGPGALWFPAKRRGTS